MKTLKNKKKLAKNRRHSRIRTKVIGTSSVPRLCVFRSNKHIYAQLIDDDSGVTITSASDIGLKNDKKVARATEVGMIIAKAAKAKKITSVVFDRGGFIFTGRVKALASSAREGGLKF